MGAEGARRKPNLSGKRTERMQAARSVFLRRSCFIAALFFYEKEKEKCKKSC